MSEKKEYYEVANCGRGFERTFVRVDKQTMRFWRFQHEDLLERYAFEWDDS
jgi:hypothetical protein